MYTETWGQMQSFTVTMQDQVSAKLGRQFDQFKLLDYTCLQQTEFLYKMTIQTAENEKIAIEVVERYGSGLLELNENIVVSTIS